MGVCAHRPASAGRRAAPAPPWRPACRQSASASCRRARGGAQGGAGSAGRAGGVRVAGRRPRGASRPRATRRSASVHTLTSQGATSHRCARVQSRICRHAPACAPARPHVLRAQQPRGHQRVQDGEPLLAEPCMRGPHGERRCAPACGRFGRERATADGAQRAARSPRGAGAAAWPRARFGGDCRCRHTRRCAAHPTRSETARATRAGARAAPGHARRGG